ncbi:cortex morphogenetic protein CmpA [Salimicrobium halophilum]|uniref:Cortex morphogenetic protein CmpA n=1 Tax=Salimicrobium halophilum TaxID=86666 RepID=A0A1G8VPF0_9BACI|nr:cortex morphogenetic protein CmpA [Salimicrobium halophilum]SDJ67814.1 hypothetical protein SAMN04490247_2804 [Salimicrobium halophilum]
MPSWLISQLREAYRYKNIPRILLLNRCWFYYDTIWKKET